MSMLCADQLSTSIGTKQLLKDICFQAKTGEFIGLIGPNGAGKTTLLRALLGLIASSGKVLLDDKELRNMRVLDRAKAVSYLPQERDVAWPVSVETLVALGRQAIKPVFSGLGQTDYELIEQAMLRMDVAGFRKRSVNELSGGERARVMIARVLAQNTPIILADEPTAGLDPSHEIGLMECFSELAKEGRTVIASLHELSLAAKYCTRLIVLNKGQMIADGVPRDVLTPVLLDKVYGIRAHIMMIDGEFLVQPTALT